MTDPSISIHFVGFDVAANGVAALVVVVILALILVGARVAASHMNRAGAWVCQSVRLTTISPLANRGAFEATNYTKKSGKKFLFSVS